MYMYMANENDMDGLHLENAAKTNSFIENQIVLTSSINQHKMSYNDWQ